MQNSKNTNFVWQEIFQWTCEGSFRNGPSNFKERPILLGFDSYGGWLNAKFIRLYWFLHKNKNQSIFRNNASLTFILLMNSQWRYLDWSWIKCCWWWGWRWRIIRRQLRLGYCISSKDCAEQLIGSQRK